MHYIPIHSEILININYNIKLRKKKDIIINNITFKKIN